MDKETEKRLDKIEREILVGMGMLIETLYENPNKVIKRYREAINQQPDQTWREEN